MRTTKEDHKEICKRTADRHLELAKQVDQALRWRWKWLISITCFIVAFFFKVNPGLLIVAALILFYLMELNRMLLAQFYQRERMLSLQEEIMDRTRILTEPK